jgi:uncharacterized protein (DUF2384 family)
MKTNATSLTKLAELKVLAIETFGSESKAEKWLNTNHLVLGTTPKCFAESDEGFAEVIKILDAIGYGGVV